MSFSQDQEVPPIFLSKGMDDFGLHLNAIRDRFVSSSLLLQVPLQHSNQNKVALYVYAAVYLGTEGDY